MARLVLMSDLSEAYAHSILHGIVRYSNTHDPWVLCKMPLSVYESGGIRAVIEFAEYWKADAIIGQFKDGDDVDMFRRHGIIAYAQDNHHKFDDIANISGDYEGAGVMAAEYFISLGAVNFAFYGQRGRVWSEERRDAFISCINSKVPSCTISIKEADDVDPVWWYDVSDLLQWLENLPKPVAIFASDDNSAFQIAEACRQSKSIGMRVPDDIIILGVDNDESLCQLCSPMLSSIEQKTEQAGYDTAAMIEARLALPMEQRFEDIRDVRVELGGLVTRRSSDVFFHDNAYLKKVCTFISQNIATNISVKDLVALVPMSRRLLEKVFREKMGTSIYQYIIDMRVSRMKRLIDQGRSPQQAAAELGIDCAAISRNFKAATGLTPVQYAKQLGK